MTSMIQRQESLIRTKPGHRMHLAFEKRKMTFSSRPPHRRTILKDWENKYILATKQHRAVHKDTLHRPKNTNSLRDTRDNTAHMVFEGEPAVKLHAKNIEVRTSANEIQTHPFEFEVARCRPSPFARCFLPAHTRVWNDLPYRVFDTGTLDGFKRACQSFLASLSLFFSFSVALVLVGLLKQFIKKNVFPHGPLMLVLIIIIIIIIIIIMTKNACNNLLLPQIKRLVIICKIPTITNSLN